jgi:DNA invertase Pin-like site-specific DNA recombinase
MALLKAGNYKVLSLLRISTDDQDLEGQREDIQDHIRRFAENGINLEIVKAYEFEGVSGAVVHKTHDYKTMLAHLEQPTIIGLLFQRLDRLMRPEDLDAYGSLKVFRTHKKLMFCDSDRPLDITNPEDRTLINARLEAGHTERLNIKRRTHNKKEQLIEDPTVCMVKLPKGVEHIRDIKKYGSKTKKGFYRYTEFAHTHVKPAFEAVAKGESTHSVCKRLGFSSVSALRLVFENKWWLGIMERIWTCPVTKDEATGKKIVGKRQPHPKPIVHSTNLAETPLISEELFMKVQAIIGQHKETFTFFESYGNEFLCNGLLFCQCGKRMYLRWDRKNGKPAAYVCSGKCGVSRVNANCMDLAVWLEVIKYFSDEHLDHAIAQAQQGSEAVQLRDAVEAAKNALEALETRKRRIQKMLLSDDEDADALKLYNEVKRDISAAKIRIATAEAEAQPFKSDDPAIIAKSIKARFAGSLKWKIEQKKLAFRDVLDKIILSDHQVFLHVKGGLPLAQQNPASAEWKATMNRLANEINMLADDNLKMYSR